MAWKLLVIGATLVAAPGPPTPLRVDRLYHVVGSPVSVTVGARSLYLVMVTRRDPPLALSKLRASGQLQEVRLRDLAFNASETEALLERGAGISISADALATVQTDFPGFSAPADFKQKVVKDFYAICRVDHLRVELQAVNPCY